MTVIYKPLPPAIGDFDTRVSGLWYSLLRDVHEVDKVPFYVNEGHRTLARQTELVRQLGVWSATNQHGAAWPSATAPHIRSGRADHAIDVVVGKGAPGGCPMSFVMACAKRGVHLRFPVPGEPWHAEASLAELQAHYDRAGARRARAAARRAAAKAKRAAQKAKVPVVGVNAAGVKLVATFEGFRADPYKPVAAEKLWTIGYGHTGAEVEPGMRWSRATALRVLAADLRYASQAVRKVAPWLNANQHAAVTSLVFNGGAGLLEANRSLGSALRARKNVPAAMRLYVKGADGKVLDGLVRRRLAEIDLYQRPLA